VTNEERNFANELRGSSASSMMRSLTRRSVNRQSCRLVFLSGLPRLSAFDDAAHYELTEPGKQFVHYAMNEVVPRLD